MRLALLMICGAGDAPLPCLETLRDAARPGDTVILADTGMAETAGDAAEAFWADEGPGEGVAARVLRLPGLSRGGAGQLALEAAEAEAVLFLDAGLRLLPRALDDARAHLAEGGDALIAAAPEAPGGAPDAALWRVLAGLASPGPAYFAALAADPGRLLCRRDFLKRAGLRLAEGEAGGEAGSFAGFHWRLCQQAGGGLRLWQGPLARRMAAPEAGESSLLALLETCRTRLAAADADADTHARSGGAEALMAGFLMSWARSWPVLMGAGIWEAASGLAALLRDPAAVAALGAVRAVLEADPDGRAMLRRLAMLDRLDPASAAHLWQGAHLAETLAAMETRLRALEAEAAVQRVAAEQAALHALAKGG